MTTRAERLKSVLDQLAKTILEEVKSHGEYLVAVNDLPKAITLEMLKKEMDKVELSVHVNYQGKCKHESTCDRRCDVDTTCRRTCAAFEGYGCECEPIRVCGHKHDSHCRDGYITINDVE